MQDISEIRLDKTKFSVSNSFDNTEEKEYWHSRTPQERLAYMEMLRRINYGIELAKDFKEFLKSLNANGVRYLLIGGYAVGFHGYPRATNDLDVFVSRDLDNAQRLVICLKEFGFAAVAELSEELFIQEKSIIRMGAEPIKIEIVNFISGVEFEEAYKDRIIGIIDEIEVSLISLHHLKISKRASGRYKDLNDLEYLP